MNLLDVKISYFDDCHTTTQPDNRGTFFQLATSERLASKHRPLIEEIRATDNTTERKELKKRLPIITPSGTFSHRSAAGLIRHSGLLSFDLDAQQNPFLDARTVNTAKAELSKLPEVAFCQISASGNGLWGVVPLAFPDRHKEQFEALETAFNSMGYVIDPSCKDVCRPRFWSYDPEPYFNAAAQIFTGLPKPRPVFNAPPRNATARPDDLAGQAADYLIKERVSLECTYANFLQIAFACKSEWGDAGKEIALDILHACTTFSASNTARNFDTHWRNIRRDSGRVVTAGSLVKLAKDAGFKYRAQDAHTAPQLPTAANYAPAAGVPAQNREHHTNPKTGQAFDLEMTADGYPAGWDAPADVREALAAYGWKFEGRQPITEQGEKEWQESRQRAQAIVNRARSRENESRANNLKNGKAKGHQTRR